MPGCIQVEQVSKRFLLGRQRAADLREKFAQRFLPRSESAGEFWALRDISFTVEPGTALGIVGHNGSGKSTMLKLLTGILKPTSGQVRTEGRISALIEVGAGFHPDLTGRENVYLNGSLLGLSRREIAARYDAIVDFAGLENFMDVPVKRYSNGMFMRLGFAVATHTEPDILIIDEVLAVGDALFQNKCLRRMKDFVAQGGTLVFVSHSMGQVADLCRECVWLDHGRLLYQGETRDAVEHYMEVVAEREEAEFKRSFPEEWAIRETERREIERLAEEARRLQEEEDRRLLEEEKQREEEERKAAECTDPTRSRILGVELLDATGRRCEHFEAGSAARVRIQYRFGQRLPDPIFGVDIYRVDGLHMFTTSNYDHELSFADLSPSGHVVLDLSFLSLNEGTYRLRLSLFAQSGFSEWYLHPEHVIEDAAVLRVSAGRFANGCAFLPARWSEGDPLPPVADAVTLSLAAPLPLSRSGGGSA